MSICKSHQKWKPNCVNFTIFDYNEHIWIRDRHHLDYYRNRLLRENNLHAMIWYTDHSDFAAFIPNISMWKQNNQHGHIFFIDLKFCFDTLTTKWFKLLHFHANDEMKPWCTQNSFYDVVTFYFVPFYSEETNLTNFRWRKIRIFAK